ncbi:MAG: response regulator [Bacillota bacterium]
MNRILIVDDSPLVRMKVKTALQHHGYQVQELALGTELLDKMSFYRDLVDLIILDVVMPELDGISVLEQLKKSQDYRYIPVIMLTSKVDLPTVQQAFKLGAVDYVAKPYDDTELVHRVKKLLPLPDDRPVAPKQQALKLIRMEINRAKRNNSPISLFLFQVGKVLLMGQEEGNQQRNTGEDVNLIETWKEHLREIDSILSLEDGTVLIILPFTCFDGARIVAGKLKEMTTGSGSTSYRVLSEAGTSFPDDGKSPEELMGKLYASLSVMNSPLLTL